MADFLPKGQYQVQSVEPRRVENIGSDISNIIQSVGEGARLYNTIGVTAAKLQYSTDVNEYRSKVADIKAKLAHAGNNPQMFIDAQNELDLLGADFISKADAFKDHKDAFDAYRSLAVDITSEISSDFKVTAEYGFVKESINKNKDETISAANLARINPTAGDLDSALTKFKALPVSRDEVEGYVATPHLFAMDEQTGSDNPSLVAERIVVGKSVDRKKLADYLNTMTGSLVKYIYDEKTGNVSLDTSIQSEQIRKQYIDKYEALYKTYTPKQGREGEYNVDYHNMMKNTSTLASNPNPTFELQQEKFRQGLEQLQTYEKSVGFVTQSPSEQTNYLSTKAQIYNEYNQHKATYQALVDGRGFKGATYTKLSLAVDKEGKQVLTQSSGEVVDQKVVESMINAYQKDVAESIKNYRNVDKNIMSSLMVNKDGASKEFVSNLISSVESGVAPRTLDELKSAVDIFSVISRSPSIASNQRSVLNKAYQSIDLYKRMIPAWVESGMKKEDAVFKALKQTEAELANIPNKIRAANTVTSFQAERIAEKLDMEGLLTNPSTVGEELVESAFVLSEKEHGGTPDNERITQYIEDNGTNLKRVFDIETGTRNEVILRPKSSNGIAVTDDQMFEFFHKYKKANNINLEDFKYYTMPYGESGSAVYMYKRSNGSLYSITSGDTINKSVKIKPSKPPKQISEEQKKIHRKQFGAVSWKAGQ